MSVTLWFMGRPSAGKSTLARRVASHVRSREDSVENLDGDGVRRHFNADLDFTKRDREINNRRTAHLCALLNRHDVVAVTGMITPFRDAQREARRIIDAEGRFVLIYVRCSVDECANRDPKGLYEQAEAGEIENFTGVSHPFEPPDDPDILVDTERLTVDESVDHILEGLEGLDVFENVRTGAGFDVTSDERTRIERHLRDRGFIG